MPTIAPPPPPSPATHDHDVVEFDAYVDAQIRQTRRSVKAVDLSYALLRLALVAIVFFLLSAVVEHWCLKRGFDLRGRLALFACLATYTVYALLSAIGPLITRSINPMYAAQAIERGGSFKNALVNLLQLRSHKGELPPAVLEQLEQQAAERLSAMPEATLIDRTGVVRIGTVLVGALAVAALYAALSPKDLFTTARRVLAPWADIPPPSRVQITNITPGAVELMQGDPLVVAADVTGLGAEESVKVTVVADDNPLARSSYSLSPEQANSRRYQAVLFGPQGAANPLGVQHNLRYLLEAGDGRSRWQRVTVTPAPAIAVRSLTYNYPAYTGYAERIVEHAGDIRGLEGTKITIVAEANAEIRSAQIDLNSDGKPDVTMSASGRIATGHITLGLSDDRLTPRHSSYQLRLTTADDLTNNHPARHKIEVLADLAPEVELLAPLEPTREVALDEEVQFVVESRDPDFGLTAVRLHGESAAEEAGVKFARELLAKPHSGKSVTRVSTTARELGLKPGDTFDYWAEAVDGKTPIGNRATSVRQSLRVLEDAGQQAAGKPRPQKRPPNNRQRQPGNSPQDQPGEEQGAQGDGGKKQGESGQETPGGEAGEGQAGQQNKQSRPEENQQESGEGEGGGVKGAGQAGQAKPGESNQGAGGQSGDSASDRTEEGQPSPEGGSRGDSGDNTQSGAPTKPGGAAAGGQQRTGDRSQQPNDPSSQPVARDGSDDGSALEKMLDFLGGKKEPKAGGQGQEQQHPGNTSEQSKTPPDQATPRAGHQGADPKGAPNRKPTQESPGDEGTGDAHSVERPDGHGEAMTRKEQQKSDRKSPTGDPGTANDSPPRPDTSNGSGSEEKPQGAPLNKQTEQRSNPSTTQDNRPSPDDHEPPSPLKEDEQKHRPTSQKSDKVGDRMGGGKEGGGQDAPQKGTGSSGQNESADSGDGQSSERGAGDAVQRPGDAQQSAEKTGRPGDRRGEGSQQQAGAGDKPGGEDQANRGAPQPGESAAGQPTSPPDESNQSPAAKPGEESGERGEESATQQQQPGGKLPQGAKPPQGEKPQETDQVQAPVKPTGSGATENPGGGAARGAPGAMGNGRGGDPEGDAANLKYAKEQLNLVLEKLSDQLAKKEVDRKLLDELGWSEQDVRTFVERWRQRQQVSQSTGKEQSQQELDQALRSLGLRAPQVRRQTVAEEDNLRDLNQGIRTGVPMRFRDRLRAYNQGVSQNRDEQ